MRAFGIGLVALALAGCGVDPDAVPPGETPPQVAADASVADDAAGGADAAPVTPATLDLEVSGIILPAQGGFEQLEIPFGSSRLGTEATLQNVIGNPLKTTETFGDCWLTQVEFEGLTVSFNKDNRFVGYWATAPFVPEISRAEMLADPQVSLLEDSTIGEEFAIGDPRGEAILGLFSGPEDDARIESLYTGENCIFR